MTEINVGRFRDAAAAASESARIAEHTGQPSRIAMAEMLLAFVAAVDGDEERCRKLAARSMRAFVAESNVVSTYQCEWAVALLDLGKGRHEAALSRLEGVMDALGLFGGNIVLLAADQVEAAVRLARPERASAPMASIEWWARVEPASWSRALLLRCQALIDGDEQAYVEALTLHAKDPERLFDRARTELLYGEWLRRERRKTDARAHLREALEAFERLGAAPWADRALAELRAAGETSVPAAGTDLAAVLTPQEFQVVRLAAVGATNKEIGAQLFLSPKTVGHHLYRAFPKLAVTTRAEQAALELD